MAEDKKSARGRGETLIFLDESGFSQRPSVRRSWGPRGKTPVVVLPFSWKRLSVVGALATDPAGRRARLFLSLRPGSIDGEAVVAFAQSLHRHIEGRLLLVIDRLRQHTHGPFPRFAAGHRAWLRVEYLPTYAPELQPLEGVWDYFGRTDLANYCSDELADLPPRLLRGTRRLRRSHRSGVAFLRETPLFT